MKKIFLISLAVTALIISPLSALAWVEPSDSPPIGNVSSPIHRGVEAQTKTGALTILGDTNAAIKGFMVGSSGLILQNATQNLIYGNVDATSQGNLLNLQVEGSTKFIIDKDGNVGIGTSNPLATLDMGATGSIRLGGVTMNAWPSGGGGGSGTDNYLVRWNGTNDLEDSSIYQADDGNITVNGIIHPTLGIVSTGPGFGWRVGNPRGIGANDLQTHRDQATEVASGAYATIGGGQYNTASGQFSTVAGGRSARATETYSTVGGGKYNYAFGYSSTVPGGFSNTASGEYSFAAGKRAKAISNGAFALADSQDADFNVSATDVFGARFQGGYWLTGGNVGIGNSNPAYKLDVTGDVRASGYIMGAKTRYLSIAPSDFVSNSANNEIIANEMWSAGAGVWAYRYAPVHLPHGAIITGFKVRWYRNDPASTGQARLKRYSDGVEADIARADATQTIGAFTEVAPSISNGIIDNDNYYYQIYLRFRPNDSGADIRFRQAVITYTITEPLP